MNTKLHSQRYHGVCEWFNGRLGFGFIRILEEEEEKKDQRVLIHKSNILSNNKFLKKDDKVTLYIKHTTKGDNVAVSVRKTKTKTKPTYIHEEKDTKTTYNHEEKDTNCLAAYPIMLSTMLLMYCVKAYC